MAIAIAGTTKGRTHEIDTEEAHHLADDTRLLHMVKHKQDNHIVELAPLLTTAMGRPVQGLS